MTIFRVIDGSDEVNDVKNLQTLLRCIKVLAERGLGRKQRDGICYQMKARIVRDSGKG